MKKILLGAAAALLMTGCAQNELLDSGIATPNDGKVRFSGTTGLVTTRAAEGNPFNSTSDLQKHEKFYVVGYSGMDVIVPKSGGPGTPQEVKFNGVSWEYGNNDEPYWPSLGTMDFFAYANWGTGTATLPLPAITAAGIKAENVTIAADKGADEANSYKQTDLLVATTLNASKEVRTLLNFKHALTQIVFKAGNINPDNIDVRIGGVEIVNVGSMGNMEFLKTPNTIQWKAPTAPAAATAIVPNGTAVAAIAPTAKRATYGLAGIDDTSLSAALTEGFEVPTIATADANTYSKYPRIQTALEPNNNALIVMPQNFKSWDANSGTKAAAVNQFGAYIHLKVLIKKPSATAAIADSKFVYAGTSDGTTFTYGDVFIPVESLEDAMGQWVPGKRINYVITFGDNNSGSGGGGYDENGDPILVPIRFRAVVEDWTEVDVPLLTATFEATSEAITHKFINGYTNQLLNDVKAAPAPKVYKSEIKIKGTVSSLIATDTDPVSTNILANTTFQDLLGAAGTFQNAKFRPGSTLVYDFGSVTDFNGKTITVRIPEGWEGRLYSAREANGSFLQTNQVTPATNVAAAAGQTLAVTKSADGTTTHNQWVVLTKVAINGTALSSTATGGLYPGYSYICHIPYIEDNLAAVEMNENYAASLNKFNNTVYVKGTFPLGFIGTAFDFSSEALSKFVTSFEGSKVTIDFSGVTETTYAIKTWVPAGWSAQVNGTGTVSYPGDPIQITQATTGAKTMVFTKTNLGIKHNYVRASILIPSLNVALNTNEFYWDNVDYNVNIKFDTKNPFAGATWANLATGEKVKIYLKYPLLPAAITESSTFTKGTPDADGYITYVEYTK